MEFKRGLPGPTKRVLVQIAPATMPYPYTKILAPLCHLMPEDEYASGKKMLATPTCVPPVGAAPAPAPMSAAACSCLCLEQRAIRFPSYARAGEPCHAGPRAVCPALLPSSVGHRFLCPACLGIVLAQAGEVPELLGQHLDATGRNRPYQSCAAALCSLVHEQVSNGRRAERIGCRCGHKTAVVLF